MSTTKLTSDFFADMGTKIKCSKNDNVESVVSRPPCDEENNEAPDEIRIVKNELNDSFEPDLNEIKSKARRKKSKPSLFTAVQPPRTPIHRREAP